MPSILVPDISPTTKAIFQQIYACVNFGGARAIYARVFQLSKQQDGGRFYSKRTRRESYQFMDDDLVCNYRKCRKRLTNYAWVRMIATHINKMLSKIISPHR